MFSTLGFKTLKTIMSPFHPHRYLALAAIFIFFILMGSYTGGLSLPVDSTNEEENIDIARNISSSENVSSEEDFLKSFDHAEINDNNKILTNETETLEMKVITDASSPIDLLINSTPNLIDAQILSSTKSVAVLTQVSENFETTTKQPTDYSILTSSKVFTEGSDVVLQSVTQTKEPKKKEPIFKSVIFDWLKDSYTLSILIPVAAGAGSAIAFLSIITLCVYLRKRCCLCRKKTRRLPDSVRKMRLDDRKILLEGTSDEEL